MFPSGTVALPLSAVLLGASRLRSRTFTLLHFHNTRRSTNLWFHYILPPVCWWYAALHICWLVIFGICYKIVIMCRGRHQGAPSELPLVKPVEDRGIGNRYTSTIDQVLKRYCRIIGFPVRGLQCDSAPDSIRLVGVTINQQHLSFDSHLSKLVQSCNYHLRWYSVTFVSL